MCKVKGSCQCGAIHFESDFQPTRLIASNCRHDHRHPKATIAVSVGVFAKTLRFRGLIPSVYEDARPGGSIVLRSFCPECGTPLFTETDSDPSIIFIKVATLDAALWAQPQVFYSSARHRRPTPPETKGRRLLQLFDWVKRDGHLSLTVSSTDRLGSTPSLNYAHSCSFRPSIPTH